MKYGNFVVCGCLMMRYETHQLQFNHHRIISAKLKISMLVILNGGQTCENGRDSWLVVQYIYIVEFCSSTLIAFVCFVVESCVKLLIFIRIKTMLIKTSVTILTNIKYDGNNVYMYMMINGSKRRIENQI